MKKFVINTKSHSSDDYTYFIQHPEAPTSEELERFLKEHACDRDEDEVYEYVKSVHEIIESEFLTIPNK